MPSPPWIKSVTKHFRRSKGKDALVVPPAGPLNYESLSQDVRHVGDDAIRYSPLDAAPAVSISPALLSNMDNTHTESRSTVSAEVGLEESSGGTAPDRDPRVGIQIEDVATPNSPDSLRLTNQPLDEEHRSHNNLNRTPSTDPHKHSPAMPPPNALDASPQPHRTPLFGGNVQSSYTKEMGFLVLAEGCNPIVDIILVHGLDGHRKRTFMEDGVCWPEKVLPKRCANARIATYGFNSATDGEKDQLSAQCLWGHGDDMIKKLLRWRETTDTERHRPLVFLAYSIGGLVLKHALIIANSCSDNLNMRALKLATYGIIFLGTPHQGVPFEVLQDYMNKLNLVSKTPVVRDMKLHSEHLYQQLDSFTNISSDFDTKLAYEVLPTRLGKDQYVMLVPKGTAVLPGAVDTETMGMNKNHNTIAQFSDQDDDDFETLVYWLKDMILKAPIKVERNFSEDGIINASTEAVHQDVGDEIVASRTSNVVTNQSQDVDVGMDAQQVALGTNAFHAGNPGIPGSFLDVKTTPDPPPTYYDGRQVAQTNSGASRAAGSSGHVLDSFANEKTAQRNLVRLERGVAGGQGTHGGFVQNSPRVGTA